MIRTIKAGRDPKQKTEDASKIRQTVEGILALVESRGNAAVLELLRESDAWSPEQFRLSEREIGQCLSAVRPRELEDIRFAKAQVRGFAEIQKGALRDSGGETLPGVVSGHKNIPMSSVACYVPGGRYPLVASAHMGVVTAKVAGVQRVVALTSPFRGKPQCPLPGTTNQRCLRRQGDRNESYSADPQRGALYRWPVGG